MIGISVSGMPDNSPQVPAADQTLRILAHLARQPGPVSAQTLATALGIPRSSVYHLLAALERGGVRAALAQAMDDVVDA